MTKENDKRSERYLFVDKVKVEVEIEMYRKIDRFDKRQKYRDLIYSELKGQAFDEALHGKSDCAEDEAINRILYEALYAALDRLSAEDRSLIRELFYLGTSERSLAEKLNMLQSSLHYHKDRILRALRKTIKF